MSVATAPGALARWKQLVLAADDPQRLGGFWADVIGLKPEPRDGAVELVSSRAGLGIWVGETDRPKRGKHRLHLDVYAPSVAALEERGAQVLLPAAESGLAWTVMRDPESGEFCCFERGPEELPAYRLHGIGVDCADPAAQARWWGLVLGVEPVLHAEHGWWTLERVTPDEVLTIDFSPVPETPLGPNRVHWDVHGDRDALVAAGASHRWDTPGWTVLADPEGNDFCVFAS